MLKRRQLIQHAIMALASATAAGCVRQGSGKFTLPSLESHIVNGHYDARLRATYPKGGNLRIVARSGVPASSRSNYHWHSAPDGGACFASGWLYVSNSERSKKEVAWVPFVLMREAQ